MRSTRCAPGSRSTSNSTLTRGSALTWRTAKVQSTVPSQRWPPTGTKYSGVMLGRPLREQVPMRATRGRIPGSLARPHPATKVDGTQVEPVDPLVNQDHHLLAGGRQTIGVVRDAGQVAAVMPAQHNRLRLRPLVAGKAQARARDPLQ